MLTKLCIEVDHKSGWNWAGGNAEAQCWDCRSDPIWKLYAHDTHEIVYG